jgi:hypothetical protein
VEPYLYCCAQRQLFLYRENTLTGSSQLHDRIQYSITYEAAHTKVKVYSHIAQTQNTHVKVVDEFSEVNSFQNFKKKGGFSTKITYLVVKKTASGRI